MKNQTFGIEIETTGLGRERTAQVIAELFGTTARYIGRHLGDWHIPMPDGRKWVVERDGSVTDPSAEVVSPVCRWDDIPMVQEVVRVLRHSHPRRPRRTHPAKPAPSGQHCQRQGRPADTGAGHKPEPPQTVV